MENWKEEGRAKRRTLQMVVGSKRRVKRRRNEERDTKVKMLS